MFRISIKLGNVYFILFIYILQQKNIAYLFSFGTFLLRKQCLLPKISYTSNTRRVYVLVYNVHLQYRTLTPNFCKCLCRSRALFWSALALGICCKVSLQSVFRIHIHWIRIQPKIWIRIQAISYHYLNFFFYYFISIRFSYQKKSIEWQNVVKVTKKLKECSKSH